MSAPEDIAGAPPVGEEVHMPAPSALPLINAAALAIAILAGDRTPGLLCVKPRPSSRWSTITDA